MINQNVIRTQEHIIRPYKNPLEPGKHGDPTTQLGTERTKDVRTLRK